MIVGCIIITLHNAMLNNHNLGRV